MLGAGPGVTVGLLAERDGGSNGFTTGATVALVVVALYALRALQTGTIARWAGGRALGSLGLLVPLATRALPMLLLFITFLFINTEVWQVADALSPGVLGGSVLFFGLAAVFFLVSRLGEELDDVDDLDDTEAVVAACGDTPLQDDARELAARGEQLAVDSQVVGLEKANLVLALVIAQAVQVLLLALAVSAFFIVFGAVAIDDDVIDELDRQASPDYPLHQHVVSVQLLKVAIFLGSFSGLYFTVYAVTDATYRQQFFTEILRELERAVGVRAVYRDLQDRPADARSQTEVGQHRLHPPVDLQVDRQVELGEDAVDVLGHGLLGDVEGGRDRGVRPALGHQRQHLPLAGGEPVQRLVALPGHHRGDHLGVEHRAALQHPAYAVDELAHVGDPVLEQVADRTLAAGQQLAGVELLDVLRQHQHREPGPLRAHGDRGAQPLVGERRRHPYVEDRAVDVGVEQRLVELDGVVDRRATTKPEPSSSWIRPARRRALSSARTRRSGRTAPPG